MPSSGPVAYVDGKWRSGHWEAASGKEVSTSRYGVYPPGTYAIGDFWFRVSDYIDNGYREYYWYTWQWTMFGFQIVEVTSTNPNDATYPCNAHACFPCGGCKCAIGTCWTICCFNCASNNIQCHCNCSTCYDTCYRNYRDYHVWSTVYDIYVYKLVGNQHVWEWQGQDTRSGYLNS